MWWILGDLGGYSSNLWENPLLGNLHHNISAAVWSFLRTLLSRWSIFAALIRPSKLPPTNLCLWVNLKQRRGKYWGPDFLEYLHHACGKVICYNLYFCIEILICDRLCRISRFYLMFVGDWESAAAQTLNYGKPLMGLPLCQTKGWDILIFWIASKRCSIGLTGRSLAYCIIRYWPWRGDQPRQQIKHHNC